jgi:tripartite-type tricarboxylate transporter receptor subunit TctC
MTARFWRRFFYASIMVLACGAAGHAQTYPSNIVRMIVPSPAGTPPDIMGRILATELSESEGWRVIVENKVGAIQTIGLAEVLKQPADGHTLASIALPASAAPALIPTINFRLDSDFTPVIKLASAYHILVVTPSVPANSLSEFVAWLKSNPDKMSFSSGGFGTPACHSRAVSGFDAGDHRSDERDQSVPVHHPASRPSVDRHGQVARTGRDRASAAAGREGCADGGRGGFP